MHLRTNLIFFLFLFVDYTISKIKSTVIFKYLNIKVHMSKKCQLDKVK